MLCQQENISHQQPKKKIIEHWVITQDFLGTHTSSNHFLFVESTGAHDSPTEIAMAHVAALLNCLLEGRKPVAPPWALVLPGPTLRAQQPLEGSRDAKMILHPIHP